MKCDSKMMIKIGVGMAVALVVAYFFLPGAHAWVVASAPILLALICPLSMLFMMKSMNSGNKDSTDKMEKTGTQSPDNTVRNGD